MSVSDPVHFALDLYRTPCSPYGIRIGAHSVRMGSVSDHMHSAGYLYHLLYPPYGTCIRFHAVRMGLHQVLYTLPWICIGPHAVRVVYISERIQSVWDLYRIPYIP